MAGGAVVGAPYAHALAVFAWAEEHWPDVDGRLAVAGVELAGLPVDRALNVLTAMAVDDAMPVVTVETKRGIEVYDRRRVRGEVLASLRGAESTGGDGRPTVTRRRAPAEGWDRDTWGLMPEHQAGLRAAMGFAAGLGG